jgi:hypothetical protein
MKRGRGTAANGYSPTTTSALASLAPASLVWASLVLTSLALTSLALTSLAPASLTLTPASLASVSPAPPSLPSSASGTHTLKLAPPGSEALSQAAVAAHVWLVPVRSQYGLQTPAPESEVARQLSPSLHVAAPMVSVHASPAWAVPLGRHANAELVVGQQTWPEAHSQGFSLHGVPPLEPDFELLHANAAASPRTAAVIPATRKARLTVVPGRGLPVATFA